MRDDSMRELAKKLGLTAEEYDRIVKILGREPNYTEVGIFSVMWSEHCCYKSSLVHLRRFPKEGERVLAEPGKENAGVLKLNDEWAVAFKVESHNHPSAIEPFQGAATGVGGILRDIFCMGAYPIASFDSLRFGELSNPIAKHLFDGVVRGIAFYGNCFGVPTVGGEVYFDDCYLGNPLVNVMAVGIVRIKNLVSAKASGPGNPVVYIGSSTGRDGIHGASFASVELTEKSEEDRPAVQIGDPFTEKLLLEATQELVEKGLVLGMQDMGAAGLTSSSAEMAAKGGVGIELDLDKVPLREEGMTPYEIMLSESQERMLLITEKNKLDEIKRILDKWGLHYSVVGRVIEEPVLRVYWRGEIAAEIPTWALLAGEGAPIYDRPQKKPDWLETLQAQDPIAELPEIDAGDLLPKLLGMPTIASKKWVYRQYDHQVGIRTVMLPGAGDAAVMRIMETGQFLSIAMDGNGAYSYLDPYAGGAIAVLEAARNVAATGAKPIGITDCLNFGNPTKPEVMYQFANAVLGIADACRELGIPVTGGNVSFYNESPKGAVFPTPVVGMVGIIEDESYITTMNLKAPRHVIAVIGKTDAEIGGSQLQKIMFGRYFGKAPKPKIAENKNAIELLLMLIHEGIVLSAHDVSDGGIGVALAEMAIKSDGIGMELTIPENLAPEIFLFSETQGRFIVEIEEKNIDPLLKLAEKFGIKCEVLGATTDEPLLKINDWVFEVGRLREIYDGTIPNIMS